MRTGRDAGPDTGDTRRSCLASALLLALASLLAPGAAGAQEAPRDATGGGGEVSAGTAETSTGGAPAEIVEPAEATETSEPTARSERGEDVVATLGTVIGGARDGEEPDGEPREETSHHRITWHADWPRYSFDEAVMTLSLGALLIASIALPADTSTPNWTGGILFDDGVRDGLRLRLYEQRESARIASDVLMGIVVGYPFLIDAFGAAGIGDGNWDVTLQMGLIGVEAYVVSLVVWRTVALLARRQRPVGRACEAGDASPHCTGAEIPQSFFSNHTMNAFTGASLMCLYHTSMPLYGDEAADATACVTAMTAAATVGLLRMMSDFEYFTDVLAGAIVGLASGWLLPYLLHFAGGARPELRSPVAAIPAPMITGDGDTYGVQAVGWF